MPLRRQRRCVFLHEHRVAELDPHHNSSVTTRWRSGDNIQAKGCLAGKNQPVLDTARGPSCSGLHTTQDALLYWGHGSHASLSCSSHNMASLTSYAVSSAASARASVFICDCGAGKWQCIHSVGQCCHRFLEASGVAASRERLERVGIGWEQAATVPTVPHHHDSVIWT